MTQEYLSKGADRQYAYFSIYRDFDPETITHQVGIAPHRFWKKGDPHPRTGFPRQDSSWQLHSCLEKSTDLEDHIADVFAQLTKNRPIIQKLSRQFGGYLQLVVYSQSPNPGLHLKKESIIMLADYALSVDFDMYSLADL